MISRIGSALALAVLVLGFTAWGGLAFALLWVAAAALFMSEFLTMADCRPRPALMALGAVGLVALGVGAELGAPRAAAIAACLVAFALVCVARQATPRVLPAAGFIYAACVAVPVILLRSEPARGLAATIWLYAAVWATDIGAFFVGRAVGGPKLWPRISPNKTWAGLIGGTILGVAAAAAAGGYLGLAAHGWPKFAVATLAACLATHAGDLFESALKRHYKIKDSSQLIPGHGGFMDRLDGFAAASVVAALTMLQGA